MATLYAQPYAIDKTGFYFTSAEQYEELAEKSGCEEFEIQFIDGDNPTLFENAGINQSNLHTWFDSGLDDISDDDDAAIQIAFLTDTIGMPLDEALSRYDEVNVYHGSASDYAFDLVQEGFDLKAMGNLANYIDYDSLSRDMLLNSEIVMIERQVIVTNPNDF